MRGTCGAAIALVLVLGLVGLESNGVIFAHATAEAGAPLTRLHAALSYDELEEAASAHGMELIHPSEWEKENPSRRLASQGVRCWFTGCVSLVQMPRCQ